MTTSSEYYDDVESRYSVTSSKRLETTPRGGAAPSLSHPRSNGVGQIPRVIFSSFATMSTSTPSSSSKFSSKTAPVNINDGLDVCPESLPSFEKKSKTFDSLLLDSLGGFGRYQFIQFFLLCLPTIFVAMHVMSWTFMSVGSPVSCTQIKNETVCVSSKYSAADRWEMNGANSWMKASVQSFYFFGQMTGSFLCGIMADRIGRKKVFFLSLVIQTSCGLMLIVTPWWWLYAIFKAGTGFTQPGIFGIAVVLGMELVGAQYRSLGAIVANLFCTVGQVILAILAYFIDDYRVFHAAIAVPSLIFLSYWWIIRESARWLVSKERYDEAHLILNRAAKINKKFIPANWMEYMGHSAQSNQASKISSFGVFDLVRTPQMRLRSLTCFFVWPVTTMMYYGLTMKSDLGGGNLYVNFVISAVMEVPALIATYLLIDRVGRKPLVSGGLLVAGTALVFNWAVGDNVSYVFGMSQMMVTKGAVTLAYTAMYTYTSELFPTVIRNTAVGCCSTVSRVGAITSSYIALYLVERYGKLTMVVPFAVLAIAAAVFSWILLPETMNKEMPETISQVENQEKI
ncbi:unnamed protein product [Caenorhabditis auriculariae]|uniref:Major facilitator superfamily (MFS) profile domain-containing protein n=1 Tax=Caenorhabditis auriculariae TaxID=2777116 RepID=A0A8S1HWV8_9PELO|nr:unnamed protein product [Caenorhabditis auriculariae]